MLLSVRRGAAAYVSVTDEQYLPEIAWKIHGSGLYHTATSYLFRIDLTIMNEYGGMVSGRSTVS